MNTTQTIRDEILKLKKEHDVCILAHAYQSQDIWEVADYVGDSYGLSLQAAKTGQQTVLLCGVRFMAETVKILSPEKKCCYHIRRQAVQWRNRSRLPNLPP